DFHVTGVQTCALPIFGLSPPTGPDDVTLRFDNVPPGRYRVRVIVNGGYASSVVSGSTDLQQNLLTVDGGSAPQPIEITVRDDGEIGRASCREGEESGW